MEILFGLDAYRLQLAAKVVVDRLVRHLAVGGHHDGFLRASGFPIRIAPLLLVDLRLALAALHIARVDALYKSEGQSEGPGPGADFIFTAISLCFVKISAARSRQPFIPASSAPPEI